MPRLTISALLVLATLPGHAWAQSAGTPVDEPANLALFGLGLVGLIVGRHAARRKD